ncbi:glycosyltransferase family 87 protein [Streptomyces sp. NPDC050145]|uniref:glycosyltransferase family 87 protein n=1 Tax=Streptomyces sp. NPDC050145 TaxID=3365602 RepID=UPI0037B9E438
MNQARSPISSCLLRPASRLGWVVLGVVLVAVPLHSSLRSVAGGMDNGIVVQAARVWLDGGSPYADPHFLYFPSAVLAAVPQALVPVGVLRACVPALVTCGLAGAWAAALRLYGVPWRSRFAVGGLLALALGFAPFAHLVTLGNWTVTAAVALPCALLLAVWERWLAAGLVLGAALALKPLLAPVALLFVLARRWKGLAAMVLVPVVASLGAALAMPDPAGFVTRTLPFLLRGGDGFVRLYEASPGAVLARLGLPAPLAGGIALVGAATGVWCATRRWGRGDRTPARLSETATLLMLSAFLVSRPSYDHYLLVAVPLLVAGATAAGAAAGSPWFWAVLLPQVPGLAWPWLDTGTRRAFLDCATLCGLVLTVGLRGARRAPLAPEAAGEAGAPTVPGARDDDPVLTRPGRRGYSA